LKEERILDEILFLSRNGLIEWSRKRTKDGGTQLSDKS